MKWIKYQIVQSTIGEETILVNKKVGYNEENLAIAESEAYNGYEIVEDAESFDKEPLAIELGGTNAKNGSDALKNLLAQGYLILSPYQYGDEYPEDAPDGALYLKKVSN